MFMRKNRQWMWFEVGEDGNKQGNLDELLDALKNDRLVPGSPVFFDVDRYGYKSRFEIAQLNQLFLPDITFNPLIVDFIESRLNKPTTILSGANNAGKSLALKAIYHELDSEAYLVGTSRIYSLNHLNTGLRQSPNFHEQFIQQFYTSKQNRDDNQYNLQTIITSLRNSQRDLLFELCEKLLGSSFEIRNVQEDNDFSPMYVAVDGQEVAASSTGTRLLMTLIGICLDDRFSTLLIDEPEIGLSPKIQMFLAQHLYDQSLRKEYFPHLEKVFIATHSHIFLDSNNTNNFIVTKDDNQVSFEQARSISDYHRLQFNLLGNDLESLFLPSAIVMVEGDTDKLFLEKLLSIHFPDRNIPVVLGKMSKGDGAIPAKLYLLEEALGDLRKSPYKDRIIVVLDSKTTVNKQQILNKIRSENLVVWSKNGIEYLYPTSLLAEIFSCDISAFGENWLDTNLRKESNREFIEINGIKYTKIELATEVAAKLTLTHTPNEELNDLIRRIQEAVM